MPNVIKCRKMDFLAFYDIRHLSQNVINIAIWVSKEQSQPEDLRYELQSYQNYNKFFRKIKKKCYNLQTFVCILARFPLRNKCSHGPS